jgi:hypothetical protein
MADIPRREERFDITAGERFLISHRAGPRLGILCPGLTFTGG